MTKMIETERLILRPLTFSQIEKYIKNDNSLEKELNLNETNRTISPDLAEAFEQAILPNLADKSKNYLYTTLWTLILKEQNKMVGDLCFVGEPNEKGEIEIGYGTYEDYRGNGYMKEAVKGMIEWAKTQPDVFYMNASTDKSNIASYTLLEKNNFAKISESEHHLNWQLKLK